MALYDLKVQYFGDKQNLPNGLVELLEQQKIQLVISENFDPSELDDKFMRQLKKNHVLIVDFMTDSNKANQWISEFHRKLDSVKGISINKKTAIVGLYKDLSSAVNEEIDEVLYSETPTKIAYQRIFNLIRFHMEIEFFKNDFYNPLESTILTYNHDINNKLTIGMWAVEDGLGDEPEHAALQSALNSFQQIHDIIKKIEAVKKERTKEFDDELAPLKKVG